MILLMIVLGPFEKIREKALFCSKYSGRTGTITRSLPIIRRKNVVKAAKETTFTLSLSPHTSTITLEIRNTIQLIVWPPSEKTTLVPQERGFMQKIFMARDTDAYSIERTIR